VSHSAPRRLAVVVAVAVFGLWTTDALALGPEPAPSGGHSGLRPDPAPGSSRAVTSSRPQPPPPPAQVVAPPPTNTVSTSRSTIVSTPTTAQPRPKPAARKTQAKLHRAKAQPKRAVDRARAPTRVAIGAVPGPTSSSGSNLLLLGGLALLLLALGETSFLALSVRFLRGADD
jgi:hypothetical protein